MGNGRKFPKEAKSVVVVVLKRKKPVGEESTEGTRNIYSVQVVQIHEMMRFFPNS